MGYKQLSKIAGWIVFGIAAIVYALTAESTGSLWDCGEFITGAYKLEVVHPPGAPVFILIGRVFTLIASIVSDNPESIAYSVNLMSGLSTAAAAMFIAWTTIIFGKIALVGRDGETDNAQNLALAGAGIIGGLSTAFCVSIWFSAVEGEVYAMSLMFTAIVIWGMSKWYSLPNDQEHDRWIVFSLFMTGLSIGVHLLSLLTLPAMGILYAFKKYGKEDDTVKQSVIKGFLGAVGGLATMIIIQNIIIVGAPTVWKSMEFFTVNDLGLPQHSGVIPMLLLFVGIIVAALFYAKKRSIPELQYGTVAVAAILIAYSSVGLVVIRAGVNTPINMNDPSNAMRLLPYLNREQYGERPLLSGPDFTAPVESTKSETRYDYVESKGAYLPTDQKLSYTYKDKHKKFFPRLGHSDRDQLYMQWLGLDYKKGSNGRSIRDPETGKPALSEKLGLSHSLDFFFNYQIRWMYIRYFMWNFSGKQNKSQGFFSWDATKGHWITGINAIDKGKIGDTSQLPTYMKNDQARNAYYMIPFIFGLLGLFFFFSRRPKEAVALLALFLMTGIAIIIYSNQPPNEPRERDYVLVGSFATYCMFIGMGALFLFDLLRKKVNLEGKTAAIISSAVIMIAPILMGTQNYDDNDRSGHYGARDYASNFLNSVEKDAIIFTYGDNDTYPLWYAQEVEGIRTDVRVVNLSLIQVDWYINQLRRKVNDSAPIKFSVAPEKVRGKKRNQFIHQPQMGRTDIRQVVKFMGDDHPIGNSSVTMESFLPTTQMYIDIDTVKAAQPNWVDPKMVDKIQSRINFDLPASKQRYVMKGDLAMLDIIASNINERPIYYAVTVRTENMLGLQDYLQMEGLALRLVPVKAPRDKDYQQLGVLGYGYVYGDKLYDNITNKWKFGGFDQCGKFVDDKYSPSIQSMLYVFKRGAKQLLAQGEKKKTETLLDSYFTGFPNCNFPLSWTSVSLLDQYAKAGAYEKVKPLAEELLTNTEEELLYVSSVDPDLIKMSQGLQYIPQEAKNAGLLLQRLARDNKDMELLKTLDERLKHFGVIPPLEQLQNAPSN